MDFDGYFERLDALENSRAAIETLDAALDRSRIDPAAKMRALDGEPEALATFVRDEIVWQPYPGSLRAARGTLIARAGNSLDQSILLATLINRAGWDARLARATLDEVDARRLLASADLPGEAAPSLGDDEIAALREASPAGSTAIDTYLKALDNRGAGPEVSLDGRAARILEALGDIAPAQSAALPTWVLPAARDYWWIQYRTEPAGAWEDVHPAFPGGAPESLSGPEEVHAGSVPQEYVQHVTLRLMMEIRRAERTDTITLVELEEIPASSLEADPVTLTITPSGLLSAGSAATLYDRLSESEFFVVGLNGQSAHDPISLNGQVIPAEAFGPESFGAVEIFANLAAAGAKAASAVSGREDDIFGIQQVRLEIASNAPQIGRRETVRILYDPRKKDGSLPELSEAEIAAGVTGSYQITAHTGGMSETGLLKGFVDFARARLPVLEQIHRASFYPEMSSADILRAFAESDSTLPLKLLSFMETEAPAPAAGAVPVQPHLRIHGVEPVLGGEAGDGRMRASIDLVQTPAIALSEDGETIRPRVVLHAGLWSSHLETLLLPEGKTGRVNTAAVYARVLDADIDLALIRPGGDAGSMPDLPEESLAAIERDLGAGFAVIAPVRLPEGEELAGWWRVHPDTGETLAMLGAGRGADITEYAQWLSTTMMLADVLTFQYGVAECLQGNNSPGGTVACCIIDNSISIGRGAGALSVAKLRHPALLFGAAFLYVNMYVAGQFMETPLECQA